jgi:hypothetical protein
LTFLSQESRETPDITQPPQTNNWRARLNIASVEGANKSTTKKRSSMNGSCGSQTPQNPTMALTLDEASLGKAFAGRLDIQNAIRNAATGKRAVTDGYVLWALDLSACISRDLFC